MAIFLLIFFLLLTAYCLLVDYYRRAWHSIPAPVLSENIHVKISVIVAARNEEGTIGNLLESLARQDYPEDLYEVIIVNDHSSDGTANRISFGRLIELPPHLEGKKNAIAFGINAAMGELIVTTDADCKVPPAWLKTIAAFYSATNAKFIAAPVMIAPSHSWFSIFQSLDFLTMQGISGASVYKKFHSMCNGANLAYPRNIFFEVNGFDGIDNIPSGDDMLLMHKIFMRYPNEIFYLKDERAIVTTVAEKSWKDFLQQRVRWASKAVHYKDKRIFYVLLLTYLVNVCFLITGVMSFFNTYTLGFFLLLLLAKVIIEFPFVNAVAIFFKRRELMRYFVFFEPLHICYIIISGWLGRFGSYTWKSRKIKNTGASKILIV